MFALGYLSSLAIRIHRESTFDDARAADVIIVMGAAEYSGRPSPVLKLRLDHAVELSPSAYGFVHDDDGRAGRRSEAYGRRRRPVVSGGAGGAGGGDYCGVSRAILTVYFLLAAASEILKRMGLRSAIVVSDGYHLFRAKRILMRAGLTAYGSPRADGGHWRCGEWWLCFRQAVGYGVVEDWGAGGRQCSRSMQEQSRAPLNLLILPALNPRSATRGFDLQFLAPASG